jgi:hypothetical protein
MMNDERQFADLRNVTNLDFVDISSEIFRTYVFPGDNKITILDPLALNVSKNGHRVWDSRGFSHYIPQGWIHLYWQVHEDEPHFVK